MPDLLKHPVTLAILGAIALFGVGVAVARSGNQSDVELTQPSLTSTAGDVPDDASDLDPLSETTTDILDFDGDRPRASTGTVFDVDGERPGAQVGARAVVDQPGQCLWLADVPGEAAPKLFIVAWPNGTEIDWDPFELFLPDGGGSLFESERIVADATIVDTVAELTDTDRQRLLGMDDCQYDGVLVLTDSPDNVEVIG